MTSCSVEVQEKASQPLIDPSYFVKSLNSVYKSQFLLFTSIVTASLEHQPATDSTT
jgi:hypothetical protein